MAVIRYKDTDGHWVRLSASDIGAASDSLIARGVGKPIVSDTNTHIQNDTVLYIDQNEYDGDNTTITRFSTDELVIPVPITQGGTGANTLEKARENLGISISTFINTIYPVGSIYMSVNPTNPVNIFGFGTWKQIQGRFLVGVGNNNASDDAALDITSAGAIGGVAKHKHTTGDVTLTADQSGLPAHKHTVTPSSHDHTIKMRDNTGSGNAYALKTEQGAFKYRNDYINSTTIATVSSSAQKAKSAHNHGDTNTVTNIPPYYAVYIWERTD